MALMSRREARYAAALGGIAALVVVAAAASMVVVYAGLINVAADEPHSDAMFWLMQTARARSVAIRANDVVVPDDLDDPKRHDSGVAQYAEMCSDCHLAPGMKRTEVSRGLYPRAPVLSRRSQLSSAETFWVIKHGIKMSGMPAWGTTHNDDLIWNLVAFLKLLPDLTPEQYKGMVESAPKSHDDLMEMEGVTDGGSHH